MSMDLRANSPKNEDQESTREFHARPVPVYAKFIFIFLPRTHHKPFVPKHEETKIEFVPFSLHDESREARRNELEELRKKREADREAQKQREEEEKKVIK